MLLARSETGAEHAYLADFGLTKTSTTEEGAKESITLSGSSDYVSPEQIRGAGSDQSSDIYALGCVAYECLSGHVPYRRPGELETLFAHINDAPPRASAANPDLAASLDPVLAKALAKEPAERYPSAMAFVDATRSAVAPTAHRVSRRAVTLLAALLAVVVAAVAVPVVLLTGDASGPPQVAKITTVAGTGHHRFSGEGGPAVEAKIALPRGPAVDGDGNVYFGIPERVLRVDTGGVLWVAAGSGMRGFQGDGLAANEVELNNPRAAVDPDGALYTLNYEEPILHRIDEDGTVTTIAGSGSVASQPIEDGSLATETDLCNRASGPAVDPQGNVYFACTSAVFKIDSAGLITRVAGTGESGFADDGGPATAAQLKGVNNITFDAEGNLYIADGSSARVRKVDTTGTISTLAGTGTRRNAGDGGPAILADLHVTQDVAVDQAGTVYVAFDLSPDPSSDRNIEDPEVVRAISNEGVITTVAGGGTSQADGVPATYAALRGPLEVAVDTEGNLYIAEDGGHRVRKVTLNP